jgi:hypothetical protein
MASTPFIQRLFGLALAVWAMAALPPRWTAAASGEETAYYVEGAEGEASAQIDVAVALSEGGDEEFATPVEYAQTEEFEPVAEEPLAIEPPPAPAEEVTPDDMESDRPARQIFRPITEVTADATLPEGLLPEQVPEETDRDQADMMPEIGDPRFVGGWGEQSFLWTATGLCHGPLYFEEVNLERYGYQCHPAVQPFVSGAHFFLTVPTLPYQMTVHPPRECIYTLGHYRPGSRVPWQRHHLPWDARAAAVQAGVTVGLVFLIP